MKMKDFLKDLLKEEGIFLFGDISLADCKINKPYLLEKEGISDGTVFMVAIPYYTKECENQDRNISAYAIARDYHLCFSTLWNNIITKLKEHFPNNKFCAFSDHSPIDEREAAAKAGLGVYGDNGMLLTKEYGPYIFLAELITDEKTEATPKEIEGCMHCGACEKACPKKEIGVCLSALTQKKGTLTSEEESAILSFGSAWGCDICAEVCPYTKSAKANGTIYSQVPFFSQDVTPVLTLEMLDKMSDEEFSTRAYAWRGKDTIKRNLKLYEEKK